MSTDDEHQPWYAVRCVVVSDARSERHYEERITVWRAESFEQAIEKAEREAIDHARSLTETSYTGLAQAFHLFDAQIEEGSEVFSLIRMSRLPPDEYLSTYFDTGAERQGSVETP